MCGIFCELLIRNHENSNKETSQLKSNVLCKCRKNLENRGPDSVCGKIVDEIELFGTVLHQQGIVPFPQPVINEEFILLFNGDLFMDLDLKGKSDTHYLECLLRNIPTEEILLSTIATLKGPYSIIYYNRLWKKLYFLRDPMGRNSLLIGCDQHKIFLLSVACFELAQNTFEVPPVGVYCYDLSNQTLQLFPWYDLHDFHIDQLSKLELTIGQTIQRNEDLKVHLPWLSLINIKEPFTLNDITCLTMEDVYQSVSHSIHSTCDNLIALLSKSVQERIYFTPNYCKVCVKSAQDIECQHCKVGILFSGGLDCSIIAILADKFVDPSLPIDLFNVAFESVRRDKSQNFLKKEINWNVPDRITAKETFEELKSLCPNRIWNLVEINVRRDELQNELQNRLKDLVSPLRNILDESLGAALWFAARGIGEVDQTPYSSKCRVLLLGSGADELFAGYTRHRNTFRRGGLGALTEELELDWVRLPNRNLARDDRVIGDHSITARAPYLQEEFVQFVRSLSPDQRCNLNLEQGIGDKLLLRLCAYKLGLSKCSTFKKRALQFGSRIADRKQKANNVSNYFQD